MWIVITFMAVFPSQGQFRYHTSLAISVFQLWRLPIAFQLFLTLVCQQRRSNMQIRESAAIVDFLCALICRHVWGVKIAPGSLEIPRRSCNLIFHLIPYHIFKTKFGRLLLFLQVFNLISIFIRRLLQILNIVEMLREVKINSIFRH